MHRTYIDGKVVDYSIDDNTLHINNSYRYSKKSMSIIIDDIRSHHPESLVWRRDKKSLIDEWVTHNVCYQLHILRSHTTDVDLNFPNNAKWAYHIAAFLTGWIVS